MDVTLSLEDGSYRPYRKDDTVPLYIHKDSNHPPHIKKEMVKMVGRRISDLSSSEEIFKQAAPIYNQALRNSGFNEEIKFSKRIRDNNRKGNRSRRIIFFHPPWSDQIKSSVGKCFLQTRLSRAIWRLKESNPPIPFKLKFSILKLARAYTRESKNCHLCAVEKTFIAFSDPSSMLNLMSELLNKCRHRRKHLLFNWK